MYEKEANQKRATYFQKVFSFYLIISCFGFNFCKVFFFVFIFLRFLTTLTRLRFGSEAFCLKKKRKKGHSVYVATVYLYNLYLIFFFLCTVCEQCVCGYFSVVARKLICNQCESLCVVFFKKKVGCVFFLRFSSSLKCKLKKKRLHLFEIDFCFRFLPSTHVRLLIELIANSVYIINHYGFERMCL